VYGVQSIDLLRDEDDEEDDNDTEEDEGSGYREACSLLFMSLVSGQFAQTLVSRV
jgi:hypothetical protein